ncbi:MAG: RHS repeat-associated core domain-containing protein [Polyangiaceae bacterium]
MPGPPPDAATASVPTLHAEGGGGAGGGGSGKKGKKGKGKRGAGKGKGKQNAKGGKKGAKGNKSGAGGSKPCSRCNNSISRGDPVDVATGRTFTVPETDLQLFGPMPLEIERTWASTNHDRDVGMGWGWSHTLAWEVEVFARFVRVHRDDGTASDFSKLRPGDTEVGDEGWELRGEPDGYTLDSNDGTRRRFQLEGAKSRRARLIWVEDENGNRITVAWQGGQLLQIVDCVGRLVQVTSTPEGRIAALDVVPLPNHPPVRFASYRYDPRGDLVEVIDAAGYVRRFSYNDVHLLVEHTFQTGLAFHYRYDAEHRCVETWGDYPGRADISLAPTVPAVLADGHTRAKGFFHIKLDYDDQGYTEVVDSRRLQRFFANEHGKLDKVDSGAGVFTRTYDDQGNETSMTDPLGATWQWERDGRGRIVKRIDPLGHEFRFERDASGRVARAIDEVGAVVGYHYDARGNVLQIADPVGSVLSNSYDPRGLLLTATERNGASSAYAYDGHGNNVEVTLPNGSVWREKYDVLGRVIEKTDALGAVTRYAWSPRHELLGIDYPDGRRARMDYDAEGHMVRLEDAAGLVHHFEYGGYHSLTRMHQPDGSVVTLVCDREMEVVEITNEVGEKHLFEYDAVGNLVGERTFDGRQLRWRWDPNGRLVGYENGAGERIELVYDILGNIVEKAYPDGSVEKFVYDPRNDLVSADNGVSTVRLERDLRGLVVRETQELDGEVHAVACTFDAMENVVRRQTTVGLVEDVVRDAMGWRQRTIFGGRSEILDQNDLVGQLVSRLLPSGGRIDSEFTFDGQVSHRAAVPAKAQQIVGAGQPDWIGARPRHGASKVFTYGAGSELRTMLDSDKGLTRLEYDRALRLTGWLPDQRPKEEFSWDAAGNMVETNGRRVYAPGGRLLAKDDTAYAYDGDGRMIEKRQRQPDGQERVWEYAWNGKGLLSAVRGADGALVEFEYDPFARRLKKSVSRPPVPGAAPVLADVTRFVWDDETLVHEIKRRAAASGDAIVDERTYCFEDDDFRPIAQGSAQTAAGGSRAEGPWLAFLNDPNGAPDRLVGEDGDVVTEIDQSAWGKVDQQGPASTPIRYQGQYADEETGLAYNRFRYYDPDTARYISADPIGIEGGLNAYMYAPASSNWIDPFGLTHHAKGEIFGKGVDPGSGSPRASSDTVDSKMTPAQKAKIAAAGEEAKEQKKSQKKARNSEAARARQQCHTERKLVDPRKWAAQQKLKKGETMVITAESVDGSKKRPPCSGCRGAMKRLSKKTGATIVYKPGMGGRMDRPWVVKNGEVVKTG